MNNLASGQCPDELTLQLYVEGEVEAPAAELIFHHLARCQTCAHRLGELREHKRFCLERLGEEDEREARATAQVLREVRETIGREVQPNVPARPFFFWRNNWPMLPRLLWLTATAAVVLLVVFGLQHWRGQDTAFAAELLRRSVAAEAQTINSNFALHRTIQFTASMPGREARHSVTNRIEIWQAPEQAMRRVYDGQGVLLGARWQTGGNLRRYRNPQIRFQLLLPLLPNGIPRLEQLLDKEFTAQNFRDFIGNATEATVEEKPDVYVINYRHEAAGLVRATLTLRRSDLHTIAQTLVTRCRESLCESSFTETGLETTDAAAVAPGVFAPEADLEEIPARVQPPQTKGKAQ